MQVITVVPNQCVLVNDFIDHASSDRLFNDIGRKAKWHQHTIKMFAKSVVSPRLSAWYGDKQAHYRYSGIVNVPLPWFDALLEIADLVETYTQQSFNSVLLNLYRDGNDSMGSHSDNEAELGASPTIASISFGATRRFILHPDCNNPQPSIKIDLKHGSLLVMFGKSQQNWQHSLPKSRRVTVPRINLTYRQVSALQL